ncbi:hypothetical protein [Amycolatopsis sp. NBC_01480]|uniref:hypothetical protein n=1 Tax=Amycolatopsis sp. NBC_01480 TaxID=2903562 RepID=UPI002E2BB4F5|nr:hypothetical protein [Amycolatopsis sp. NBC_01480]
MTTTERDNAPNRRARTQALTVGLGFLGSGVGSGGVVAWSGSPWLALAIFLSGMFCTLVAIVVQGTIPQDSEHRLELWKLIVKRPPQPPEMEEATP